jgi:hypothetical protein
VFTVILLWENSERPVWPVCGGRGLAKRAPVLCALLVQFQIPSDLGFTAAYI